MIIDCHGHYTTAPKALLAYRDTQIAGLKDPSWKPVRADLKITDDQIREGIDGAQLKQQRERGNSSLRSGSARGRKRLWQQALGGGHRGLCSL